jgi:hypothetical protein
MWLGLGRGVGPIEAIEEEGRDPPADDEAAEVRPCCPVGLVAIAVGLVAIASAVAGVGVVCGVDVWPWAAEEGGREEWAADEERPA